MTSLRQPFVSGVIASACVRRAGVDILSTVSDFRHCTESVSVSDLFVGDVDDINSYVLCVSRFFLILSVLHCDIVI